MIPDKVTNSLKFKNEPKIMFLLKAWHEFGLEYNQTKNNNK